MNKPVLVVAQDPLPERAIRWIERHVVSQHIIVFAHNHEAESKEYPPAWQRLDVADVIDVEELRREFLNFLDKWPRQPVWGKQCFDDLFARGDGYSMWWTGPGNLRQPLIKIFPTMRAVWLISRVLQHVAAQRVFVFAKDARSATILDSQLASAGRTIAWLPGSARPMGAHWRKGWRWLRNSLAAGIASAIARLKQWSWPRLAGSDALTRTKRDHAGHPNPTLVMTVKYPRHFRDDNGVGQCWYWQEAADALAGGETGPAIRYLLCPRSARRWLADSESDKAHARSPSAYDQVLQPQRAQFSLSQWFSSVSQHLRQLLRYYRLRRQPAFRQSFRFCGADVSALYLPYLDETMSGALDWEFQVQDVFGTLRSAGDVKGVLVNEELHPSGAIVIAGCKRAGIPTVGVQHGHVYPLHMMYTLPPGQVDRAPIPDFLAVYGEYTKNVVSVCGAYPRDRVWVCGSPRFDYLVTAPPSKADCRKRLGLPQDKWILVVATKRDIWTPAAVLDVIRAVRGDSGVCVCIKPWRGDDNESLYRHMADQQMSAEVRMIDAPFEELLGAADALVSVNSTTLLEATLLGKPSLSLDYTGEPERYPYAGEGVTLLARNAEEVSDAVSALKRFSPDKAWEDRRVAFLRRHLGPNLDGQSARQLTDLIKHHFLHADTAVTGEKSLTRDTQRVAA